MTAVALSLVVTVCEPIVMCVAIFRLKFEIHTEMQRRIVTLTDKIAELEEIKNHCRLSEITGVQNSTIAHHTRGRQTAEWI
jgi:hypothetical protein